MDVKLRTDFPGGSGKLAGVTPGDRPAVRFCAEPRHCPLALWFHFRLDGIAGERVRVILANPHQTLGGWDWSGNRPVYRTAGNSWRRAPLPRHIQTPGGLHEWAWDLPPVNGTVEFAHCYPYQQADLDVTREELGDAFAAGSLGLTMEGREIPWLRSTDAGENPPVVLLTARHHAGETPGSWVLDGALRHLAAHDDLRQAATWMAVPFVDLDDVVTGSYGKDPAPHDCNRAYGGNYRPEGMAVMSLCWANAESLAFLADLHAPSHAERRTYVPVRGWSSDAPINPIARDFAEQFDANMPVRLRSPVAHVTPPQGSFSRWPGQTSTRWATESLGIDAVTLETSYQGNDDCDYTCEDYRRIGAALAETIAAWVGDHPNR
ncbi:MAG: M14-type cytosolic carboxypeptidase [Phycisphaerae bacterium]